MSDSTTSELTATLARLASGDAAARERLFEETQARLRRLASRMLHGGFARVEKFEQTDDVMQTMFLRLWKGWESALKDELGEPLRDPGVFLSRVTRLLREVLLDMARQHYGRGGGRPGQVSLNAGSDSAGAGPGYDPGSESLNPEALFTEFHKAVEAGQLPPGGRLALVSGIDPRGGRGAAGHLERYLPEALGVRPAAIMRTPRHQPIRPVRRLIPCDTSGDTSGAAPCHLRKCSPR